MATLQLPDLLPNPATLGLFRPGAQVSFALYAPDGETLTVTTLPPGLSLVGGVLVGTVPAGVTTTTVYSFTITLTLGDQTCSGFYEVVYTPH
jgi:hypothetical protein